MKIISEFKAFVNRGSAIDMAVLIRLPNHYLIVYLLL